MRWGECICAPDTGPCHVMWWDKNDLWCWVLSHLTTGLSLAVHVCDGAYGQNSPASIGRYRIVSFHGGRLEEHLLTANLLLDKAAAAGITVWIVSLDLSKAFDRVHWPTLWVALREQGVPEHLVWLLENAYDEQLGEVMGKWGKSRSFSITGGVRQGCVLSPRLFTAVLEWALRQWRTEIGNAGFDLGDALDNLVDLRFADDILLFANSGPEVAQILDKFVKAVGKVGLRLNVDKTVILTNEAQPPSTLVTKDGLILKVLERNQGQKWLGCILTACGSMMQHLDLSYHMEQGTKSMHANRWILQDKTTSIYTRLKYFNACVSAVVCFGGGHRTLYKKQLYTLDVLFRKLCRSIVTPPSDTDWSLEWHEILHRWNDRARTFAQTAGLQPWSYCVCRQHWKLASHIANLPEHRLVRRILAWNPSVRYRSLGRRPHTWDYQLQAFCRYKGLGPWLEEAKYHHHWNAIFEDFYTFCQMWEQFEISCETNVHISFHRLCPKWARLVAYRHWPLTIDHGGRYKMDQDGIPYHAKPLGARDAGHARAFTTKPTLCRADSGKRGEMTLTPKARLPSQVA